MLGYLVVIGTVLFLAIAGMLEGVGIGNMDGMLEQYWLPSSRDKLFEAVWLGVDCRISDKQAEEIVRSSGWVIEVGADELGHDEYSLSGFPGVFMQEQMAVG